MDLYLLRHAEAGEAPRDEDRQLTERGRRQARAVAAGIAWLDLGLNAILTSPLPRATQTAQPVADALRMRLASSAALATGHHPAEALALLHGRGDAVLLVGHEPQLAEIIRMLTGGRAHVRKAMLARLEVESTDPPAGAIAWLLPWKHLERLGR